MKYVYLHSKLLGLLCYTFFKHSILFFFFFIPSMKKFLIYFDEIAHNNIYFDIEWKTSLTVFLSRTSRNLMVPKLVCMLGVQLVEISGFSPFLPFVNILALYITRIYYTLRTNAITQCGQTANWHKAHLYRISYTTGCTFQHVSNSIIGDLTNELSY